MDKNEPIGPAASRKGRAVFKKFIIFAVVAMCYLAAAKLGLLLADPVTMVTPVWPAAGVSLGILVAFGWRRTWLPVLASVVFEDWLDSVLTHSAFSCGDLIGNALGPLLAAWLVERFATGRRFLDHPAYIVRFVVLGACTVGTVSAACGVLALCLSHEVPWSSYGHEWTPWCVSDIMGALLLVPALLAWSEPRQINRHTHYWWLEVPALILVGATITQFAFGGWPFHTANPSLEYLCIPVLMWTAFRFPDRGVTTLILGVATLAIINTHLGFGPFARQAHSLTLLQIYLGSTALLALVTSAVVKERGTQARTLQLQAETLQQANAEAQAARAEAEQANEAKSQFLSRMSHELRTPLNAILGFGQLLEMSELPPAELDSTAHILRAGRHLLNLVNDVLDIARIETGQANLSLEPVAIAEVTEECLNLVQRMAALRNVKLDPGTLSSDGFFVMADRQRLRQVLLNFLSNGIKYNREEGGVVTLSTRELTSGASAGEGGERRFLRLEVADTGTGLSADEIARLFVPFERLGAECRNIEGSGLGLSLSKHLAEAMGGRVGVESQPGAGSTFWIELPLTESPFVHLEQVGLPLTGVGEIVLGLVLYIEDNLSNLRLIERLLERQPRIELHSAMQGMLGLEMARARRPDLILLDLHLPDIPGWDVLARLQADVSLRDIPVVVISADATSRQIERLMKAGARAYLTKPVDVGALLRVMEEHLGAAAQG